MPVGFARQSIFASASRAVLTLSLATVLVAAGTKGLQTAVANGDTRTLSMHHSHTGEDITVTFKRNGRYDDAGLDRLNHFLRDWRNDQKTRMDPRLFDVVWEVYQEVDAKQPVVIISAYRSPQTNAMLRKRSSGVAQFSQHMLGRAMDFAIPGVPLEKLRIAGLRLQRGGVGYYPTSGSPFVHLDVGSVRHWPRMSRDQLARVFPDGRTVHVPSDGRPLARYAEALADLERRGGAPSQTSLAAARSSGAIDESGARKGRTLFARLFGLGEDDDEDSGKNETAGDAKPAAKPAAEPRRGDRAIAAVPLPPSRPEAAGTRLAAAAPQPAPRPVQTTTYTVASAGAASVPAGPQLQWQTGPQGREPQMRWQAGPQGRVLPAAADSDDTTTASLTPWPAAPRDRTPPDVALAYAAPTPPEAPLRAAPMGTRAAAPAAVAPSLAPLAKAEPAAKAAPTPATSTIAKTSPSNVRIADPWLRGLVLAADMRGSMTVTRFGAPDYRLLRPLMDKPATCLALGFADDPNLGMTFERFDGAAVAFVPTMAFATRTAALGAR